jgi:hypothetical protein
MATHSEVCPLCGMRAIRGSGRYLGLTQELITCIIKHYISKDKKPTQRQFCKTEGISVDTYWRVTHLRLKHPADRERIMTIADELGYDILTVSGHKEVSQYVRN